MSTAEADPSLLLAQILEKEKRVKELREISSASPTSAQELNELLHRIRKEYKALLIEFPGFCHEKKDIFGLFWKNCFYKHIEEFRKSIKRLKGQIDIARSNDKIYHLARLSQEFSAFINDSSRFIQKLMTDLEKKAVDIKNVQDKEYEQITNGVYRCLLYLGDLARYKELYSTEEHKDFTDSVRYYERAFLLMPSSGNPHNQLAMLATYNEAESTALYHYCRSVMTENPFSGGFENLARLFALNKNSYESLKQQVAQFQREGFHKAKKNEGLRFKYFLTSFVRLHSLFFAWTIRMHREYLKTSEGCSQDSLESSVLLVQMNDLLSKSVLNDKEEINVTEIQELTSAILEEFEDLIFSTKLTDLHLLRLIAISMFSVHFSEMPSHAIFADSNFSTFLHSSASSHPALDNPGEKRYRSIIQSLCLSSTYGLISRVSFRMGNHDFGEKPKRNFLDKALPMLAIFAEWLGQHPTLLATPDEVDGIAEDIVPPAVFAEFQNDLTIEKWRARYCVTKDHVRMESRSKSNMKSALCMLKENWETEKILNPPRPNDESTILLLREHAELRGYLPMSEKLESYFHNFDPLRKTITWMSDPYAKNSRRQSIIEFANTQLSQAREPEPHSIRKNNRYTSTPQRGILEVSSKEYKNDDKSYGKQKKAKKSKESNPIATQEVDGKNKAAATVAMEDFPSLPGGRKFGEAHPTTEGVWGSKQLAIENEADIAMDVPFPEVENDYVIPQPSKKDLHSSFEQAPLSVNNSSAQLDQLISDEKPNDDEFVDDFEDVVFRPAFPRFPDQTPSPFNNSNRGGLMLNSNASAYANMETSQADATEFVASDILASLGIPPTRSNNQLGEMTKSHSTSVDLWDKLGVGAPLDMPMLESHHLSLQSDWGNNDLLSSNLLGGWDALSSNVFGNERFPAAASTSGLFPSQQTAPAVGPPGLLPNKASHLAAPPPPPGLGGGMGSASKATPLDSHLPPSSNFLEYLKTGNQTSNSTSRKT